MCEDKVLPKFGLKSDARASSRKGMKNILSPSAVFRADSPFASFFFLRCTQFQDNRYCPWSGKEIAELTRLDLPQKNKGKCCGNRTIDSCHLFYTGKGRRFGGGKGRSFLIWLGEEEERALEALSFTSVAKGFIKLLQVFVGNASSWI